MGIARALSLPVLAALLVSFTSAPSCADSWALPTKATYSSCARHARLTVTPRSVESQLRYFEDKVDGVNRAGQKTMGVPAASARLERFVRDRWVSVWQRQIANDVAPVLAIVRDDGRYAVTFDDWHGTGYGPNVVVIYGPDGKLVRALALSDVVPTDFIEALPHSVSSIQWRGVPRFSVDGQKVVVPVVIPTERFESEARTVDLAINLADGIVTPLDPVAWQAAAATARTVLAAQVAADAAAKAAFIAPLLGPTVNGEREWHDYLREAVGRLIGDDDTPSTTVLRDTSANGYAVSATWVREALSESYADKVALASLSEPNLVAVLSKEASRLPGHSLAKVTLFVAVSARSWPKIVAAMQPTGARLIQLDPAKPIPQRPERIARQYRS